MEMVMIVNIMIAIDMEIMETMDILKKIPIKRIP